MIRVLNVISDTNIGGAGRVILNYLRFADKISARARMSSSMGTRAA